MWPFSVRQAWHLGCPSSQARRSGGRGVCSLSWSKQLQYLSRHCLAYQASRAVAANLHPIQISKWRRRNVSTTFSTGSRYGLISICRFQHRRYRLRLRRCRLCRWRLSIVPNHMATHKHGRFFPLQKRTKLPYETVINVIALAQRKGEGKKTCEVWRGAISYLERQYSPLVSVWSLVKKGEVLKCQNKHDTAKARKQAVSCWDQYSSLCTSLMAPTGTKPNTGS